MDINVVCDTCGKDLEHYLTKNKYGDPALRVEPCKHCLKDAREEGIEDGKKESGE